MKRTTNLIGLTIVILVISLIIAAPAEARGGGRGGGKVGVAGGIIGLILYGIYYAIWRVAAGAKSLSASSAARHLATFDTEWSPKKVEKRVREMYYAVQKAWAAGNMSEARGFMTGKLLGEWDRKLEGSRLCHQRNVCEEIRLHSVEIVGVKDLPDDRKDRIYVLINGSMIDYLVNTRTGEFVPRNDNETAKPSSPESFWELWTLSRGRDGWELCETTEETGITSMVFLPVDCLDTTCDMERSRESRRKV